MFIIVTLKAPPVKIVIKHYINLGYKWRIWKCRGQKVPRKEWWCLPGDLIMQIRALISWHSKPWNVRGNQWMSHQGNFIPGTKRLSNPNSDMKDQCFQEWKQFGFVLSPLSPHKGTLVWDLPDIFGSHFLEQGSNSLQCATAVWETLEQVFNLSAYSDDAYHWSPCCMGQGGEGRMEYTPKGQVEASEISQQSWPRTH